MSQMSVNILTPVAGSNLLGKSVLILGTFPEFLFPNSILLCSFLGAVKCIYKSPTAIFSQPMFPIKIWTALFEKETWEEKPLSVKWGKLPRIWRNNPLKWVVSISRDYWVYSDITWKGSKNWEFWGKFRRIETFPGANLILRPASIEPNDVNFLKSHSNVKKHILECQPDTERYSSRATWRLGCRVEGFGDDNRSVSRIYRFVCRMSCAVCTILKCTGTQMYNSQATPRLGCRVEGFCSGVESLELRLRHGWKDPHGSSVAISCSNLK